MKKEKEIKVSVEFVKGNPRKERRSSVSSGMSRVCRMGGGGVNVMAMPSSSKAPAPVGTFHKVARVLPAMSGTLSLNKASKK